MPTQTPDYGRTVRDYARFRPEYPVELYERLARHFGVGVADQRVLDIGTGSGLVARGLARRGAIVTGLDPSPELLQEAARLAADEQLGVRFVRGTAESTGLPDASFDVATAAVCWHWFDAPRAAAEIRRVLVPGGRLIIIHFEWLSRPGDVVDATEELLRTHRSTIPGRRIAEKLAHTVISRLHPALARHVGTGVHPDRLATLWSCGYRDLESFSFDVDVPYRHEAWRGRIRSHAWAAATAAEDRVSRLDGALAQMLRERYPEEPLHIPHRVFVVTGRTG